MTADSSHRGSNCIYRLVDGVCTQEAQDVDFAAGWLSEPRLMTYLMPCGGDLQKAMELYRWNMSLSQAVLHDVALFEVALRNAYDRCLNERWGGDWLRDDESPVRRPIMRTNRRGQVRDQNWINRKAIDKLAAGGRTHDWIVSNLTLGFWVHMTDRSHERDLWIPFLHHVWGRGANRADVAGMVDTVNKVRNRAVHHEHLFDLTGSGYSVVRAGEIMANAFVHLASLEFCDAHPEMRANGITTFLRDSPAPVGASVQVS